MIKGTDLAYCNPNTDYLAMKNAGIRFAVLKLKQGLGPKDIMFDTHRMGCDIVGVPWDVYDFCDYRYSAAANVSNLLRIANGAWGMGHACKDLEFRAVWGYPSGSNMLHWCQDYSKAFFDQTGMVETLYTNRDLLNQMWAVATDTQKEELANHDLWFATHDETPTPTHLPILMNQYELDVAVPWCVQRVDLNDLYLDEAGFEAWKRHQQPLTLEERVLRIEQILTQHGWL